MKVTEHFQKAKGKTLVSFEVLPPLKGGSMQAIFNTLDALMEFNYGDYEGLTSSQIMERDPEWDLFTAGCPGGESIMQVSARCDAFVAKVERVGAGRAVVAFTHGHLSRILTARMLNLPASGGASLWNDTASVGVINEHRGKLVLVGWNLCAY